MVVGRLQCQSWMRPVVGGGSTRLAFAIPGVFEPDRRGLPAQLAALLHASSPHSGPLMQLRFASFAVINSREDLHLQKWGPAGAPSQKGPPPLWAPFSLVGGTGFEPVTPAV